MLPIRDNVPTRGFAWTVAAIVLLNALVLALQSLMGAKAATVIGLFGLIPSRFVGWSSLGGAPVDPWRFLPLGTSMFLHDGWLHLATNMAYLWTFGRALEARMGPRSFVCTYLFAGVAAAMGQLIAHPHSNAAMIGASGAIAGVLGAYLIYFDRARVTVAFPFLLIPWVLEIRALWLLLGWFAFQIARGTSDILAATTDPQVAWWAHATGFVAGAVATAATRVREAAPLVPAEVPVPASPPVLPGVTSVRASLLPVHTSLRPSFAP